MTGLPSILLSPERLQTETIFRSGCQKRLSSSYKPRGHHSTPHITRAETPEAAGVRELLQRDRRIRGLTDVALDSPESSKEPSVKTQEADDEPAPAGAQAAAARAVSLESGQAEKLAQSEAGPKTAGEAIKMGTEELHNSNPKAAVELFQRALELPGRGAFRMQGSPREFSCASEGEEMAALYNLACAYAALGQKEAALASLEGAFEIGFQDYDSCRTDPDLKIIQGSQLNALIDNQTSQKSGGFVGQLQRLWKR